MAAPEAQKKNGASLPRRPEQLARDSLLPLREYGVEARAEVVGNKGQHGIDVDADNRTRHAQRARDARRAGRKEACQRHRAYRDAEPGDDGISGPRLAQHVVDGRDRGDGPRRGNRAGNAVERLVAGGRVAHAGPRARSLKPWPCDEKGAKSRAPVAARTKGHDAVLDRGWTGVWRVTEATDTRAGTPADGMAGSATVDLGGPLTGALWGFSPSVEKPMARWSRA